MQMRLKKRPLWSYLRRNFAVGHSLQVQDQPDAFGRAKLGSFYQDQPVLTNPFSSDNFLQRCLTRLLPKNVKEYIFNDLHSFGDRICNEIDELGRKAELEPPALRHYDAWGQRIDEIITSTAWKKLHAISAEEGLVAIAYERSHDQWSRLHQMAKLYLFGPSSGLYSCPLAMTDGGAKLLELSDDEFLKKKIFRRLTTRNSDLFWTSGQWMTERKGGSDVGNGTTTVARSSVNQYELFGHKWFSSATDAQVAFTLARIADSNGFIIKGTEGLSLFFLETADESGGLNNIEIQRLKNKLGTRQLPTAEILLDGTKANLIGKKGRGISEISPMLNITRLHNSISAVGIMRRMMQLCCNYSTKRVVFGKCLADHPLHMQTLSRIELLTRGCTLLVAEVSRLLGLSECSTSSPEAEMLLRILTPLVKLYTAKQAIGVASEGLEAFGGQGYVEDTGLPTLLRDAQVLSIWEGTTNVLSLDVIKVITKFKEEVLENISSQIISYLNHGNDKENPAATIIRKELKETTKFLNRSLHNDPSILFTAARDISLVLAHIYIGSLFVFHASQDDSTFCDKSAALRWSQLPISLCKSESYTEEQIATDLHLVQNKQ